MVLKKIVLPIVAFSLSIFVVSCDSEKNEKDEKSETAETEKTEINANAADTAAILPTGEIALDKLPAGVRDFIEKNYAGYTISNAASDPLCQGGDALDVAVTKPGEPNLSLIFKPDGSFVQQEEDVPLKTAPDEVKDAIKSKFGEYQSGEQIEKLILLDKSVQYLVDLTKEKATKEVIFNEHGNVVCEN